MEINSVGNITFKYKLNTRAGLILNFIIYTTSDGLETPFMSSRFPKKIKTFIRRPARAANPTAKLGETEICDKLTGLRNDESSDPRQGRN